MENTCQESCIKNIDKIDQLTVTNEIIVKCIAKFTYKNMPIRQKII